MKDSAKELAGGSRKLIAILLITLGIGAVGGYSLGGGSAASTTESAAGGSGSADEAWFTCGMHPSVLQKEPGDCPICQMKLTPMKKDTGGGGGETSGGPTERRILYWRAPMDPGFISEEPGKSPMGMDLVPVYSNESAVAGAVRVDPVTMQNMGIRTARAKRATLSRTVRTVGRLDYDERLVTYVNTKFTGWIEKLHVAETGQRVEKGQPLFDVYSPELYVAQEEFLQAVRYQSKLVNEEARRYALQNLESARVKLRYYDVTDEQVDELEKSGKPAKVLTIYSPSPGIVTEKMAQEGMYVKPGMRLYTIADLSQIWVYVDVYEYQLPWVSLGQSAKMTLPYVPGRVFEGAVTYIYPYLQKASRVVKVRLEFDNPTLELKPEMYANVRLDAALPDPVVQIPREAFIDSGLRKLAFLDLGGGKFQPREIITGVESEKGMVQVLHGLDEGDIVVTSGQFLLDAESKLREAVAKMMAARRVADAKKAGAAASKGQSTSASTPPAGTQFACSMQTHPGQSDPADQGPYFSPTDGECPRCGMKLVPLDTLSWASSGQDDAPPGALNADSKFACPMPEHSDAEDASMRGPYFANEAGECPTCGMKLKPIGDLSWAKALRSAEGGDVAYSCPDHPAVTSDKPGKCPRCQRELEPFKALYTCPDRAHAAIIQTSAGECPTCEQALVMFRGPWLNEGLALSGGALSSPTGGKRYRCPVHPQVQSASPGRCTIGAEELKDQTQATDAELTKPAAAQADGAKYVCVMKACNYFSPTDGECPKCGMLLKPITEVPWAQEAQVAAKASPGFTCPMHPQVRQAKPGTCQLCSMKLIPTDGSDAPTTDAGPVQRQVDFITEHYLALQHLLASDTTAGSAMNALGVAAAAEKLIELASSPRTKAAPRLAEVARALRAAALGVTEKDIVRDRLRFSELSTAFVELLDIHRPSRRRWPALSLFRCPMAKADWVQSTDSIANPYYGFKMRTCGALQGKK